jgi:hypothetical protein
MGQFLQNVSVWDFPSPIRGGFLGRLTFKAERYLLKATVFLVQPAGRKN